MATKRVRMEWAGVAEMGATWQKIGEILKDTDPALKDVILPVCKNATTNASALAPKKSGLLADSIYASKGGAKQRGVFMGVRKKVYYARWVEFGTEKMPAQPYFRPAMLQLFGTYVNDIAPGIKQLIEATAAKNAYHPPG